MMRMFSRLTVLIAAIAPVALVVTIVVLAGPSQPVVQQFTAMIRPQWLLAGLLIVSLVPWPALTVAAIERDRRRVNHARREQAAVRPNAARTARG